MFRSVMADAAPFLESAIAACGRVTVTVASWCISVGNVQLTDSATPCELWTLPGLSGFLGSDTGRRPEANGKETCNGTCNDAHLLPAQLNHPNAGYQPSLASCKITKQQLSRLLNLGTGYLQNASAFIKSLGHLEMENKKLQSSTINIQI